MPSMLLLLLLLSLLLPEVIVTAIARPALRLEHGFEAIGHVATGEAVERREVFFVSAADAANAA